MTTIIRGARVLTLDVADTEHAKADILIEVVDLPTGGDW